MKKITYILLFTFLALGSCKEQDTSARDIVDFNFDWEFYLGELSDPGNEGVKWNPVRLPHDWSIRESYQQENTAASTGFVPGGIGWYKKSFRLPVSEKDKLVRVEFDGVYCNSEVWINGQHLGFRPNGYASFSYPLTQHLKFGEEANELLVKVDHSAYADTRWYTGSGIYRNVRLVKTSPTSIPQWGVRITTPEVSKTSATIEVKTKVEGVVTSDGELVVTVFDPSGNSVATRSISLSESKASYLASLEVSNPLLWSTEKAHLYTVRTEVKLNDQLVDEVTTTFGIRTFNFDADKGFSLNGKPMKLKGVNLHHDAGAVGAAVPKGIWEYRVKKLKSIGVNAIRMSHNPHSVELMEVCDEMGMLVMDEFFDEWHRPKGKSIVYLGDEKADHDQEAKGYSTYFLEWAERDLKDLIRRDYNHPSVIMWSIGNEIEWAFPTYSAAFRKLNPGLDIRKEAPVFDPEQVRPVVKEVLGENDSLAIVAKLLSQWVKEEDATRPVVCGSVRPSVSLVSGYADALDVMGFNYRQKSYDAAHEAYPELKIIGSENWGDYQEWKHVKERDFVGGMFAWTGFAYMGEAGPWPRKGLEISFFDYAGFKTPRGHFFECFWKEEPKVYVVTTPASVSEFSYSETRGWSFEMQKTPPPVWSELRRWEWYQVNEHWNYTDQEPIVVQTYTNCEVAELFLNGKSLGKKSRMDFEEDNIIKWLVPYEKGKLVVKGYINDIVVDEYQLSSTGAVASVALKADKVSLQSDRYDVAHVEVSVLDASGLQIRDVDVPVSFRVSGEGAKLLTVDNGWEMNVDNHYKNTVSLHDGKAMAIIQATDQKGQVEVVATVNGVESNPFVILVE
ncbi:MAG: glycoside hydrolase family 2 TIM barrel-domain containing protein [Bacteroidota bacterium]